MTNNKRWKIKHFEFCEQNRSLTGGPQDIYLEPLLVDVLAFFCRNPGTVVSREQLVAEVWDAKAITDNAVSRVVAKLRKALGDQPKNPQFIVTFPKKGYQFIAPVSPLDRHQPTEPENPAVPPEAQVIQDEAQADARTTQPQMGNTRWWLPVVLLALIIAAAQWLRREPATPTPRQYSVEALTRDSGWESAPALSPDGRVLAYSGRVDGRLRLFLKDLEQLKTVEIGDITGYSGPASWSDDGSHLVYLVTNQDGAFYYRVRVDGLTVSDKTLVHRGPVGTYGKMAFRRNSERLILTEAAAHGEPYVIYELDPATGTRRPLPQPELVLGGNSQFDIHPTRDALLISAPTTNQWIDIYTLDLETDTLTHLFVVKEYTCCPVWDHDGAHIVMMGEHPARDLIRYAADGSNRQVLVRTPHRISAPVRHPNGVDFLYEGGAFNRDIGLLSTDEDGALDLVVRSSVDDRLGTLSPDGSWLAFVSDRSGQDEVWLKSQVGEDLRKLTRFTEHPNLYDLAWSPDGTRLAAMSINAIEIIEVAEARHEMLKLPRVERRALSWSSPEVVSFSERRDGAWVIVEAAINQTGTTVHPSGFAYVRHTPVPSDTLWIDQQGALFYGPERTPLYGSYPSLIYVRRLNLHKLGNKLFQIQQGAEGLVLIEFDLASGEERLLSTEAQDLSIGPDGLLITVVTSSDGDIYRTIVID